MMMMVLGNGWILILVMALDGFIDGAKKII